jgi:hypothetical protein
MKDDARNHEREDLLSKVYINKLIVYYRIEILFFKFMFSVIVIIITKFQICR